MCTHFLATDIEAGGLNGRLENGQLGCDYYPIFEVACILTDTELNEIDTLRLVIHHSEEVIQTSSEWSLENLGKSGLLDEVRKASMSLNEAETAILDWLASHGVEKYDRKAKTGAVMVGNSIAYDRSFIMSQMSLFNEYLHYRQVDISALAVLSRAWQPELQKKATEHKQYAHEALQDIRESLQELSVYKSVLFDLIGQRGNSINFQSSNMRQAVYGISKVDVLEALEQAEKRFIPDSYAFGEINASELRGQIEQFFNDRAIKNMSKLINFLKGFETSKMVGGANDAIKFIVRKCNEKRVVINGD